MIVLDTTIVNVALPAIQRDLGLRQGNLTWIVNAFLVTFASFLLPRRAQTTGADRHSSLEKKGKCGA